MKQIHNLIKYELFEFKNEKLPLNIESIWKAGDGPFYGPRACKMFGGIFWAVDI